jgi:cytolysin (calcineurin-like family phosphatase)
MDQQTAYSFDWHGIEIHVVHTKRRWGVIDHLAIRSVNPDRAPLPITSTGYFSHFMQPDTVEAHGGDVVAQVTAWLDEEATKPEWRAHVERSRQGELF